tara:strand:- start:2916 stop:3749 length:834 start_codon:yes stop_codon:yes gene_type:complete
MSGHNDITVGIAGLGTMGLPMAENLLKAGFTVVGYDVRPLKYFPGVADHMTTDPSDFAVRAGVLISVVRDIAETEALLFDTQAVTRHPQAPKTVILSSTLSPRYIVDVGARLGNDVTVIDAPMSGAPYRARAGSLTFMLGGAAGAVSALMPIFKAMGDTCHHLGPLGAGAAAKVANNLCAAAGVVAVRRALAAAQAYGIDQDAMLNVMRSSSGSTWYGDNLADIDWAREGYAKENTMGILEKDVSSFMDALGGTDLMAPGPFEDAILTEIRRMEPLL